MFSEKCESVWCVLWKCVLWNTCKWVNWQVTNFQIAIRGKCKALLKDTELSAVLNSTLILLITNFAFLDRSLHQYEIIRNAAAIEVRQQSKCEVWWCLFPICKNELHT